MNRKLKKSDLEGYKTTLILLSILLAIMSLVIFMPLKKHNDNNADNYVSYSK